LLLTIDGRTNIGGAMIAGMDTALQMDNNNSYSIALLVFFPGFKLPYGGGSLLVTLYSILLAAS
jgi:hypothetical protein